MIAEIACACGLPDRDRTPSCLAIAVASNSCLFNVTPSSGISTPTGAYRLFMATATNCGAIPASFSVWRIMRAALLTSPSRFCDTLGAVYSPCLRIAGSTSDVTQRLNALAVDSLLDRIRLYKPDSLMIVMPRLGISKVAFSDFCRIARSSSST